MKVRCPHCHNGIELIHAAPLANIECPSCGSHFSLISDKSATDSYGPAGRKAIAQFQLIRLLGTGAFGSVWLAHDQQLDCQVAIKIPRQEQLNASQAEQFFREARAAAQLRHANIVHVREIGRDGDSAFIVSDYIAGANLKEWLSGQRLSFHESAELIAKISDALEHAHSQGVVHRDLKPGNILLEPSGEPHLTDFGLAKREAGEITMTFDGQILGTPAYMSPEQAAGRGHHADARSDIYSLGVVLYELLTGELPFRGERNMILLQIGRDEPPAPRRLNGKIPRDLETITLKCLQKEPGKRYQRARDLADDLRRWLRSEPINARPVGRLERGWRWCRRNPVVAGLSTAVLGLSIVLALLLYRANVQLASVYELSADEISRLEKRQEVLEKHYNSIYALYVVGALGGEAEREATAACARDGNRAVLCWARGDNEAAIQAMESCCRYATRMVEATQAAFDTGTITWNKVLSAHEQEATVELALVRLRRTLAGVPTDWFRLAMALPMATEQDDSARAPLSQLITGLSSEEIKVLEKLAVELEQTFRRDAIVQMVGAPRDQARGFFSTGLLVAVTKLQLAIARQDYLNDAATLEEAEALLGQLRVLGVIELAHGRIDSDVLVQLQAYAEWMTNRLKDSRVRARIQLEFDEIQRRMRGGEAPSPQVLPPGVVDPNDASTIIESTPEP